MIISAENHYLFIELGRTATTAIAESLVKNYAGYKVFRKHTSLQQVLNILDKSKTNYFVFVSVRDPMDKVVSTYHKLDKYWTWEKIRKANIITKIYLTKRKKYLENNNHSFEKFFLKFYKWPYIDFVQLEKKHYDFVIHFENLQSEFNTVLDHLNLERNTLPRRNPTLNRGKDYVQYFNTLELQKRAKWVFGSYYEDFHYQFPTEWKAINVSSLNKILRKIKAISYTIYYKFLWRENQFTKSQIQQYRELIPNDF